MPFRSLICAWSAATASVAGLAFAEGWSFLAVLVAGASLLLAAIAFCLVVALRDESQQYERPEEWRLANERAEALARRREGRRS